MTATPILKEKLKTVDQLIEYKLNSNDMHQKQIDGNNKELKALLIKRAELTSQIRANARRK